MMRVPTRLQRLPHLILAVLAAGTLASCGGGSDFSGDANVPDGYKTYSTSGISFAYPADWQVTETTDADGGPGVEITPPDKAKTPYGLISLGIFAGAGDRFESLADQRRIVIKDVNNAKIDSDEPGRHPGRQGGAAGLDHHPAGPRQRPGRGPLDQPRRAARQRRRGRDDGRLAAARRLKFDSAAVVETFRLSD